MTVRLRHVAAVNPPTPEFETLPDTAELPFLPLEAVWPGDRLDTTRRQSKAAVSSGYTRFREGDILLPKITPTFQADRTVIAIGLEGGVGAGTTELHVVRAGPDANARYLRYLLSSKKFLDEGEASMIGVAGQKRVPEDCLRDLVVPVVDSIHQRAIADYLDRETVRIDALIEKWRKMTGLLEERLVSCLDQLTRPDDCLLPLRRFAVVQGGITVDSGRRVTGGTRRPYLRVANVQDGYLDLTEVTEIEVTLEEASRSTLRSGDVLMTEANGNSMNLGRGTVWTGQIPECLHQNHVFAIRTDHARLIPDLLALLTQSFQGRSYFQLVSSQVGIATVSKQKVLDFPVPFIPLAEQHHRVQAAAQRMGKIRGVLSAIERQVFLLLEHRQALITATVTGEVAVPGVAA